MSRNCIKATFIIMCFWAATGVIARADDVTSPIVEAPKADKDVVKDWNGSIALGFNLAKGNSDTLLANGAANVEKLWKSDEWHFNLDGAYGVNDRGHSDEEINASNVHSVNDYRHLFTERFFGGVTLAGAHDDVADVRYRGILSPSVGYYFIKSPVNRFRGETGPAFIAEKVGSSERQYFALRFTERFEHDFTKTSKIWEQVDYLPQVDNFENYLLNSEIGAEAALNAHLSLRVVVQDKFNSNAPSDKERNDLTILAALVYNFGKAK